MKISEEHLKLIRQISAFLLLGSLLSTSVLSADVETIDFFGEARYVVRPDTRNEERLKLQFRVSLSDESWSVQTRDPRNERPLTTYFCGGGKLIFEQNSTDSNIDRSGMTTTNPVISKKYHVYPADLPPGFSSHLAFPLWLTFIAPHNLNTPTNFPDFTCMGLDALPTNLVPLQVEGNRATRSSSFFEVLNFYNTGVLQTLGPDKTIMSRRLSLPAFARGFRSATFRVTSWTNGFEGAYPNTAILETFLPKSGATAASDLKIVTRSEIILQSLVRRSTSDAPTVASFVEATRESPALVKDHTLRTSFDTPLTYVSRTNGLITKESPSFQSTLAANEKFQRITRQKAARSRISEKRLFIWIAFCALLIGFPLILYHQLKKQKNQRKEV